MLILKDFKSNVFGSAHSNGVRAAIFVSAYSKALTAVAAQNRGRVRCLPGKREMERRSGERATKQEGDARMRLMITGNGSTEFTDCLY